MSALTGRMSHIGIELRIRIPAGVIVQANSDLLYFRSKYDQGTGQWAEVLTTVDGLVIETRSVELPDSYPDDVLEDEDFRSTAMTDEPSRDMSGPRSHSPSAGLVSEVAL